MNLHYNTIFCKKRFLSLISYAFLFLVSSLHTASAQQTFTGSDGMEVMITDKSRIVSIGTAVTETIFALDAAENVVAADESSLYPDEAANLPKVSFTRNLSAEGVLSMSPSLILASGAAGPESSIRQIRAAGVPLLRLTNDETVDGAFERVTQISKVLNREESGEEIIKKMQQDLSRAESVRSELNQLPVVLFIYARGPNSLLVAGNSTSAKTMIELAGGENAFNDFDGYKPLTKEAVVAVNPDVILMMESGLDSVGGVESVQQSPGVRMTNAAKNGRIHAMDGAYLLGFGPRMGQAVIDLMEILHPDVSI